MRLIQIYLIYLCRYSAFNNFNKTYIPSIKTLHHDCYCAIYLKTQIKAHFSNTFTITQN